MVSAGSGATYFGMRMSGRWTQRWLVKGMGVPLQRSVHFVTDDAARAFAPD